MRWRSISTVHCTKFSLLFSQKAKDANIEFSYSFGLPDSHSRIITDGNRIKQIVSNLVGNAFKFTKPDMLNMVMF